MARIHGTLVRIASREDPGLIRLLLKKQPDLGLCCLPRAFWQASSIQNFRTFTILIYFHVITKNISL